MSDDNSVCVRIRELIHAEIKVGVHEFKVGV